MTKIDTTMFRFGFAITSLAVCLACGSESEERGVDDASAKAGNSGGFELTTTAWTSEAGCSDGDKNPCGTIPSENILTGSNASPKLNWTSAPNGTQSYALVLHDLSNEFTHWVLWNVPATLSELPAGLPDGDRPNPPEGAEQISYNTTNGYAGPGARNHVYEFTIYALKVAKLSPKSSEKPRQVRREILESDALLGSASLRGRSPWFGTVGGELRALRNRF